MKTQKRRLMWHGMLLFLLGLITGVLERRFTNAHGPFGTPGGCAEWHSSLRSVPYGTRYGCLIR